MKTSCASCAWKLYLSIIVFNKLAHVNTTDVQIREDVQPQQKYLSQSEKGINVTRVKALIKKNVKVFSRDYM